jgi:hypothetical protein
MKCAMRVMERIARRKPNEAPNRTFGAMVRVRRSGSPKGMIKLFQTYSDETLLLDFSS